MKNAILLHGKPGKEEYYDPQFPSASNYHWFPWLQKQLLMKDIFAQTPEIPLAFDPKYELWRKEFERYDLTPETMLVGHSCGGGFLVRWLSEHKDVEVGKVVLVAPSLNPERTWSTDFFEFEFDQALAKRTKDLVIFNSDNDSDSIQTSVKMIRENINDVTYKELKGMGHFTHLDMDSSEFSELLEELLSE